MLVVEVLVVLQRLSPVVHSVVDDVNMFMLLVVVSEDGMFGVCDAHHRHVFPGYLHDELIAQLGSVIRRESQDCMPYKSTNFGIALRLRREGYCHRFVVRGSTSL